jgi:Uma2 family endonuclease
VDQYERMVGAGVLTKDDPVELIDGEVVGMSPIGADHASVVTRISRLLTLGLGDQSIVRVQSPIRLPPRSEPEPDVVVAAFRDDFYRSAHPGPKDVLLTVEVADSSLGLDRAAKLPIYAHAGLSEVWLVDLSARAVEIYRHPLDTGYPSPHSARPGDRIAPLAFPETQLLVAEMLGPHG